MVSRQYKNRFLAARFIFEKKFPVIFPCFGCKTTNHEHPEKSYVVAPNDNVCLCCVRFGRLCDLFISESVCY